MKKAINVIIISVLICVSLSGCSGTTKKTNYEKSTPVTISVLPTVIPATTEAEGSSPMTTETTIITPTVSAEKTGYNYNIEEDKKTFDFDNIDQIVGDNYYATQINDWYANFPDYEGKTVEIEGYYVSQGQYTFVGRKGPSCPYCNNGYVCFEFDTNEDLSSYSSGVTWLDVKGIIRQGEDATGVFYYIEAMAVSEKDEGLGTVTN